MKYISILLIILGSLGVLGYANPQYDPDYQILSASAVLRYFQGGTGTSTALAKQYLWWGDGTGLLVQIASSTLAGAPGASILDTDWGVSGDGLIATDTITYIGSGGGAYDLGSSTDYWNDAYIDTLYLNDPLSNITEADPVWNAASSTFLTTASSTATYLTIASSTVTYLTNASATANYYPKSVIDASNTAWLAGGSAYDPVWIVKDNLLYATDTQNTVLIGGSATTSAGYVFEVIGNTLMDSLGISGTFNASSDAVIQGSLNVGGSLICSSQVSGTNIHGIVWDTASSYWMKSGTTLTATDTVTIVDVNATGTFDHLVSGNQVSTAYLWDNFGYGILDMTGDPWYLSGAGLQIQSTTTLDSNLSFATDSDAYIFFNDGAEYLLWDDGGDKFFFSDDIGTNDGLSVGGSTTFSGLTTCNLETDGSGVIYCGTDDTGSGGTSDYWIISGTTMTATDTITILDVNATGTFDHLTVGGITVASTGALTSFATTGTSGLTNYYTKTYSDINYLATGTAATTYLTMASSTATYLPITTAASTYFTIAGANASNTAWLIDTDTDSWAGASSSYYTSTYLGINFLSTSTAASTYLTTASSTATYLTISSSTATYLTMASSTATYLPIATAASTYFTIAGANASNTAWLADNDTTYTAGDHLTLTGTDFDLDTEIRTRSVNMTFGRATTSQYSIPNYWTPGVAITLTEWGCSSDGSMVIECGECSESSLSTSSQIAVALTCDTNAASSTTFIDSAIAAKSKVKCRVASISSGTSSWAYFIYTIND